MREIKFRAWLKEEKKMINIKAIDWDEDGNIFSVNYPEGKSYSGYGSDNIELMQYTGLKDKNGVKIFEGDIVLAGSYYEIIWSKLTCCFKMCNLDDEIELTHIDSNYIKVIGNIYENKELLNENNN